MPLPLLPAPPDNVAARRIASLGDAARLFRDLAAAAGRLDDEPPLRDLRPGSALSSLVAVQWVYRAGLCGDFARALHGLTGWPVRHLIDWKGPVHAVCEQPDGQLVDVLGAGSATEIRHREGYRPVRVHAAPGDTPLVGYSPRAGTRGTLRRHGIDPLRLAARVAVLLPYAPFTTLDPTCASADIAIPG